MRWVFVLALVGCYRSSPVDPCAISCQNEIQCPDGLACNGVTCTFANGTCEASSDAPIPNGDEGGVEICAGLPNTGGAGCRPNGGKGESGGDVEAGSSLVGGGGGGGGGPGYLLLTQNASTVGTTFAPNPTLMMPPGKREAR